MTSSSASTAARAASRHSSVLTVLLLALGTPALAAQWVAQGPGPSTNGQVENIAGREVVGAVNAVVAHPSDADILYVGTVNGGIWKTTNGGTTWARQTDAHSSGSIGALELDPTIGSHATLLAGIGRASSFYEIGGRRSGLLRSTDGGASWLAIDGGMAGRNVTGVAPRGATLVAAVDVADSFTCNNIGIFRSTDTGATWSQVTSGIPRGTSRVLASDPSNPSTLYTSIVFADVCDGAVNGLYKSTDSGASWTKVSSAAIDALLEDSTATHVEMAVRDGNVAYVAVASGSAGQLGGIFRTANGGGSWTAMDLPLTFEDDGFVGLHPGFQASSHLSIAADPTNANLVYVGGDRQPRTFSDTFDFPNSIGALDFSGRLFRGNASLAPGSQFSPLTHSGTSSGSAPHADSRDMTFDADGNLIEVDDGGVYKRTTPALATGDWLSLNGDLQATEQHNAAYDASSGIIVSGNQDTGTTQQVVPDGPSWASVSTADGGDVLVDDISALPSSIRYSSFQFLGAFRRRTYSPTNVLSSETFPALAVVGGAPFSPQFTTPLALNNVDGTRLLLGGSNSLYESLDRGNTITEIGAGLVAPGSGTDTLAYGAAGNANIVYAGACQGSCTASGDGLDGVFVRTAAGAGGFTHRLSVSSGDTVRGVVVDPSTPSHAFVIDSTTVRRTTTTGTSWSAVTGNLSSLDPGTLRSIAYLEGPGGDAVAVGADRGVFVAAEVDGFSAWDALGTGLPNVPVFELDYHAATDKLVAGTLGRGSFTLQPALDFTSIFADGFESGSVSAWSAAVP